MDAYLDSSTVFWPCPNYFGNHYGALLPALCRVRSGMKRTRRPEISLRPTAHCWPLRSAAMGALESSISLMPEGSEALDGPPPTLQHRERSPHRLLPRSLPATERCIPSMDRRGGEGVCCTATVSGPSSMTTSVPARTWASSAAKLRSASAAEIWIVTIHDHAAAPLHGAGPILFFRVSSVWSRILWSRILVTNSCNLAAVKSAATTTVPLTRCLNRGVHTRPFLFSPSFPVTLTFLLSCREKSLMYLSSLSCNLFRVPGGWSPTPQPPPLSSWLSNSPPRSVKPTAPRSLEVPLISAQKRRF